MLHDWKKPLAKYLIVLMLPIALCLSSCSPLKKTRVVNAQTASQTGQQTTVNQVSKTDSSATVNAADTRHHRTDKESFTEQADDEEVITTIREYDTNLPADTVTGTPPLRREITQTRRKAGTARQVHTTSYATDQYRVTDTQVEQRRTDSRTEQNSSQQQDSATLNLTETEKRKLSPIQQALCLAGILAICGGIVWGWRKLKRYL